MTRPHMDHNELAALLEGRLPERDAAVAHLSVHDEDAEVFADAAAVLRELEAAEGIVVVQDEDDEAPPVDPADGVPDPKVLPLRPPSTARTWRRPPARWLALAAVLAGVLLIPLAVSRSRGPASPGDYAELVARRGVALPAGFDQRPWSVTRGGPAPLAEDNKRAAKLGALQVDLELVVMGGQEGQIGPLAQQIAQVLDDVAGSGPVAALYRDIDARSGDPRDQLAETVEEAEEQLALFVDSDYFRLGGWAEAARIAALSKDAEFFRSRESRRAVRRVQALDSLDEEGRRAASSLREAAEADGEPDWPFIQTQTDQLLRSLVG